MNIYAFFEGSTEEEIIKKLFQGMTPLQEGRTLPTQKCAD